MALLDAGHEGLATYALATDDVAGEVQRLRGAGSAIGDAVAGSRRRPDGELVRWVTAFPALGPDQPPFLIEHEPCRRRVGSGRQGGARGVPASRRRRGAARVADARRVGRPGDGRSLPGELALEIDEAGTTRVGDQAIALVDAGDGPPVVGLVGERGSAALDLVLFGIRWRRRAG